MTDADRTFAAQFGRDSDPFAKIMAERGWRTALHGGSLMLCRDEGHGFVTMVRFPRPRRPGPLARLWRSFKAALTFSWRSRRAQRDHR